MKTKIYYSLFLVGINILLLFFLSFNSYAQSDKETKEALAKIDTSSFKGKGFLNKAQFIKSILAPLRSQSKEKDKDGTSILNLNTRYFNLLTTIVANADLNDKPKPKKIETIQKFSRDQITESNIIPIGIINADALLLTEAQINDNIKAKSENKKADSKDYENVEIIATGLLQGEIFQGNVNFQISPDLVQSNINNKIEHIEIDFQDGKGYRFFEFKEQLIPYQFTTIGDVAIAIKLVTKRGTFLTYNILTIHQLERPQPYMSKKTVNAIKVVQESIKSGRVEQNVVGGEYQIYTGCDGVFDKPIIIAEGFDIGQDVNISDLVAKYYPYLYAFRNHGYDLVFVNYSDGRDYMQNNAEVLKRVINEVNSQKVGNNKLVVIGESMSGLIARWALRSMENAGQTHNVSHYIAYDTPHQGANVPPGLVALGRQFYGHTGNFSPSAWLLAPEVQAIYSPAAKQLLIHQSSTLEKDPLFDSFRQDLNNLGNGGYPNQGGIRNIALVNGSLSGTPNGNYTNGTLNPGDKILDVDVVGILCNSFIDAWTNQVGQNTKVYDGDAFGVCVISFSSSYVNFNRNLDRTPGGRTVMGLGYGFPVYSTTNPAFSFVPTFSSIDYRGSLVNDNDYTFPIRGSIVNASTYQTINTSLTPFAAIYGNDYNDEHTIIRRDQEALNTLALRENFGITNTEAVLANCSLPIPSVVMQTGTYFKVGRKNNVLPSTLCKVSRGYKFTPPIMTIDLIIPNSNTTSNYVQSIRITGGNLSSPLILQVNSWNMATFNYTNLSTGTYTITTVRRFYGSNTQESTNSTTIQISGGCRLEAGNCPEDNEEGAEIGILNDVNLPCYASKYNGIWVASLEDGTFISRSRLIANGMNTTAANCFAETDPSSNVNNCNYTEGQLLTDWFGELVRAYKCGTKWYAMADGGLFKPKSWLEATGFSTSASSCFEQEDPRPVGCAAGTCTSPTPTITANPTSITTGQSVTLTASGCSGIITWNNGATGISRAVNSAGTYTATCTNSGCSVSSLASITVSSATVTNCNYTEGQLLTDWFGEIVRAYKCGTKWYAMADGGLFKPKSWLEATGRFSTSETNCFEQDDPRPAGCAATCTSPTPSITANPTSISAGQSVTLTASGCSGTITWNNGATGISRTVNSAGTYTATCTNSGCSVSSSASITVSSATVNCNYTEGQFLTDWFGEIVRAYKCGTKWYAKSDAGSFKPKSWLEATGRFSTSESNCFEQDDPRPAGCATGNSISINNPSSRKAIISETLDAYQNQETSDRLIVSPNPTDGKVKAEFSIAEAQAIRLSVIDIQGKIISIHDKDADIGYNVLELDLQHLASGTYLIQLHLGNKQLVTKIIKL